MQVAVIEYARNVAGLEGAHSEEFNELTSHPVIYLLKEWYDEKTESLNRRDANSNKGGTMRLGAYPCKLEKDTFAYRAYGEEEISERHRHRFEFNNEFRKILGENDLIFSGVSSYKDLVEIIEIKDHPWFLGCQFHPEFKSRPMNPHPLFREFIRAALAHKKGRKPSVE